MNEGAKKLIQAVDERVRQHLAKLSSDAVFQVESVNDDGTLNGYVLPDMENVIHNVVNQSKYEFSNGDLGLLYLIGNSLSNCFVITKFNPKAGDVAKTETVIENTTKQSGGSSEKIIVEAKWGDITGNISEQSDLASALDGKVPSDRTVAGVSLEQNISASDLKTAMGLGDLAYLDSIESGDQTRVTVSLNGNKYTIDLAEAVRTSLALADTAVQPGDLGDLATKDKVTNADIDGEIYDSHISSASKWDAKQDELSAGSGIDATYLSDQDTIVVNGNEVPIRSNWTAGAIPKKNANTGAWDEVQLGALATKDTVSNGDISGEISDAHISSALRWDAKQDELSAGEGIDTNYLDDYDEIRLSSDALDGISKGKTAYQKPTGGIPKTDLNTSVQDSLSLADTAVQPDDLGSLATKDKISEADINGTISDEHIFSAPRWDAKQNALSDGFGIIIDDYDEIRVDGDNTPVKSSWTEGAIPKKTASGWDEVQLGSLATKDKVSNNDIDGTISNDHISSASTWNAKQDALTAGDGIDANYLDDLKKIEVNGNEVPIRSSWTTGSIPKKSSNTGAWDEVTLATVATSGSYNDLIDQPDIPDAQIQSDWNQTDTTKKDYIKNKPAIPSALSAGAGINEWSLTHESSIEVESDIISGAEAGATAVQPDDLSTVATTGDYNDLDNTPTLGALASKDKIYNADIGGTISNDHISSSEYWDAKQDELSNGIGITIDDNSEIRVNGNSVPVRSSWTTGAVPKKNANTGAWDEVQLGSLATKNAVSNGDISGKIDDTHISSASKWDEKQDAIEVRDGLDANEFSEHGVLKVSSEVISGAEAGSTAVQPDDLGALATKDKVANDDIDGFIQDSHIASASNWNGKQDELSNVDGSIDIDDSARISVNHAKVPFKTDGFSANKVPIKKSNGEWDETEVVSGAGDGLWKGNDGSLNVNSEQVPYSNEEFEQNSVPFYNGQSYAQPWISVQATPDATSNAIILRDQNGRAKVNNPAANLDIVNKQTLDSGLSGKQDNLATQTAYSAKGTSVKVPQITTNSLGQVTKIDEVNIAFPSQTQSDWAQTDTGATDYIKNKPTLGALASKDKVSDADINGVIDDDHISSASYWNGKQNELSTGSGIIIDDYDEIRLSADALDGISKGKTAYQKPSTGIPASDINPSVLSAKQDTLSAGTGIDGSYLSDEDKIAIDGTSVPVRSTWTTGAVPKKNANTGAWDEVQLGGLATKDTVSDNDISGTISDAHIASSAYWDGKQNELSNVDGSIFIDDDRDQISVNPSNVPFKSDGFSSNKVPIKKPNGSWGETEVITTAGTGLTKDGQTLSVDTSTTPVIDRDSWYEGLMPYVTGTDDDGNPTWGAAFSSTDAVAYSVARRDANGALATATPTANNHATTKKYVDDGLSGKQPMLATQTAYSAKGTTTKVPQITTNSTGQVTKIEEVNIAFPSQVQSNWTQTNTSATDFIKNKPTLGSLSAKNTVAKTDLASDVQSSLNNADTALQKSDIPDVLVGSGGIDINYDIYDQVYEITFDATTQELLGKANTSVQDVTQNGISIVENHIAKIVLETGLGSDSNNSATVTAIRAFVNSSINALAAYYITSNTSGEAFATKAALTAGPWYYNGQTRTPTTNDYAIVTKDETHDNETARYAYTGSSWSFQYTFKATFTASQIAALNSGITAAKVALYDAHIASTSNPHSVTKAQVGLGNVDNKSEATIKSDFTGAIAQGNTGFVTGNDLFYSVPNNTSGWGDGAIPVFNDGRTEWNELKASTTPTANNLAQYSANGRLQTNAPSAGNDAVNKTYVDNGLSGKQPTISDLATIRSGAEAGSTAIQVETDPTVPSWAKQATKPTYTASEVGARPSTWTPTKADVGLSNVGNFKAVSTVGSQGLTDAEKANARANIGAGTSSFSGNYNDLSNKPTIPAAQIQSDWNQTDTSKKDYIKNKPTIPAAQVNSDWNATSGKAQILNKPTLGTLAGKNTVSNGDISGTISNDHISSASYWDAKQDEIGVGDGIDANEFSEHGNIRLTSEVISGAAAGATALQAVPSTYRTAAAQDTIDSGKLDKITETTTYDTAYVKLKNGTQSRIGVEGTYWSANTIAKRDGNGNIFVGATPTHTNHATSKKYVDDAVSGKQDALTAGNGIDATYLSDQDTIAIDGTSVPIRSSWTTGAVPKKNANTGAWDEVQLATVATSGSYNDLTNKPTIPVELSAGEGIDSYGVSEQGIIRVDDATVPYRESWNNNAVPIYNSNKDRWDEAQLATVATSGSYNDLTGKPTIPADTNQKVKAGSVTFGANDVVDVVAGSNVTVTGDATNKKITISATDTTYESKTASSGGTAVSLVTTGEKYTWNNKGTYSKPSTGIPKTDLASAVQTSLGKADTALQSFTETDPTVPAWAKAATKPSYNFSEIGSKPTTLGGYGITDAVSSGDVLMPTNPFGGKRLYINSVDNALHSAGKRYYVTATLHKASDGGVTYPHVDPTKSSTDDNYYVDGPIVQTYSEHGLFDGNYEGGLSIGTGQYLKVRIMFGANTSPSTATDTFPGYPYGNFYLSYYYTNIPSKASKCHVYNTYSPAGIGWHEYTATVFKGNRTSSGLIEKITDDSDYQRTCMEFIVFGDRNTSATSTIVTQIEMQLSRPYLNRDLSVVTKYGDQSLYSSLEFKANHEVTAKIQASDGSVRAKKFYEDGTDISSKYYPKSNPSGYTSNTGTVTSVAVKMNGATKGTVTGSGTIDLGTVLTAHQDISGKVDKVSGKGLSTNDYTTTEKNKLSGIAAGAEVNVQANWNETNTSSDAFIKNKPTLGALASKSTVSNGDISGFIQDAHIASASVWNSKQDELSNIDGSIDIDADARISVNPTNVPFKADGFSANKVPIKKPTGSWGETEVITTAGAGLTKSGGTISADPSKIPVMGRDSWYGGLVPYCTGVTNSVPSWDAAFVSNDAVAYAIAQRNGKGTVTGCQDQLYVHEGTVSINGYYNRYRILNKKSTAFTNPETDFPEHGNLFTLRTGPRVLYNLWYDDSDGTWYYTNSTNVDTEDSSYNVSIVTDYVYAF